MYSSSLHQHLYVTKSLDTQKTEIKAIAKLFVHMHLNTVWWGGNNIKAYATQNTNRMLSSCCTCGTS